MQHCVSTDTLLPSQQSVAASWNRQVSVFVQGVKYDLLFDEMHKNFANRRVEAPNHCISSLKQLVYISVFYVWSLEVSTMTRIRDVVKKALATGYLTVEAENQLRQLLTTRYDLEDFNAFMSLQEAAMTGDVKQESRERCNLV